MSELCKLIWHALIALFRSRAALEAEILVLRHQLNVLRRKSPSRVLRPGPGSVCWALCAGPYYSERAENCQTGNGGALAGMSHLPVDNAAKSGFCRETLIAGDRSREQDQGPSLLNTRRMP